MTAQHVRTLFIHTVNYSVWLVLKAEVLERHWDEQFIFMASDSLPVEIGFAPRYSVSLLSPLTPPNTSRTHNLIGLDL